MTMEIINITTLIGMVVGFIGIFRFFYSLKEELNEFKIEMKVELEKLNSKFDLLDERYKKLENNVEVKVNSSNEQITKIEQELKEVKSEQRNFSNKFFDYINNNKKPVL